MDSKSNFNGEILLAWLPGQGVRIDYAAIIEILIRQLDIDRMSNSARSSGCISDVVLNKSYR